MDTPTLILLSTLLLGGVSAQAELNLSPRLAEFEGEGMKFHHLVFSDGKKEITYMQPAGWDFSGSSVALSLQPRDKPTAQATVTRAPLPAPRTFDEDGMKALTAEALATVPKGSTEIQVLTQEKNVVKIGLKETFLVTMSYVSNGQRYGRSLMFMDRGPEQIRFQLVAPLEDFPPLQQAFLHSQFTWYNL